MVTCTNSQIRMVLDYLKEKKEKPQKLEDSKQCLQSCEEYYTQTIHWLRWENKDISTCAMVQDYTSHAPFRENMFHLNAGVNQERARHEKQTQQNRRHKTRERQREFSGWLWWLSSGQEMCTWPVKQSVKLEWDNRGLHARCR